ncbi:HD family phosphohydrolase [Paenibacillus roseipurpureus]|uniref:HD family phosphohydrolase n=1 Tax=Paenibacillus roseopurpureus TaxID=2918901 RepID=A0AA96LM67_9BACL|nr:HD family phosphohydrolase [Paenibacillus sp. MBLB1832]WNR43632.1 HD family phosphohydrolase [Paenibacillus sp. MBLB1832]
MNGVYPILIVYGLWAIGLIIVLLLGYLVYDKRYKSNGAATPTTPPNGYLSTPEVFIDPKDGLTYRVYYNPRTGDRAYIRE